MMVCCVEMDTGSMNKKQLRAKFARYHAWAESDEGKRFLLELYRRHGAINPRPSFRLLVVAKDRGDHDEGRVAAVLSAACLHPAVLNRIRIATVADLRAHQHDLLPLEAALWRRGKNVQSWFENAAVHGERKTAKQEMIRIWLPGALLFPLFDTCMPVHAAGTEMGEGGVGSGHGLATGIASCVQIDAAPALLSPGVQGRQAK